MSNWGDGYKQGYRDAGKKFTRHLKSFVGLEAYEKVFQAFMDDINKSSDGSPSQYAVANKCCGGVDAHNVGCR